MRIILLFTVLLLKIFPGFSQDFTGQWKGEFDDQSSKYGSWGGNKCEYVLDLEIKGKNVTGFSYTYFTDGAKRYYTICKLRGVIDKKKKYLNCRNYNSLNEQKSFQHYRFQFYSFIVILWIDRKLQK